MTGNKKHRMTGARPAGLLALLLAFIFSPVSAVYAQNPQTSVALPVIQKFTVTNASGVSADQTGTYEFTALTPDSPMPEGSKDETLAFTLEGNSQKELAMTYVHGGMYQYSLRQTTEDKENYLYDRRSYTVSVFVENRADGALTTQVIAENEQKEKCESLLFENSYTGKEPMVTPTPEPEAPDITVTPTPEPSVTPDAPETTVTPTPGGGNPGGGFPGGGSPSVGHNSAGTSSPVKTGDETQTTMWLAMLLFAAAGMAGVLIFKKKRS